MDKKTKLRYYTKAIKINPEHFGALCSKAATLANLGKKEEALKFIKRVEGKCNFYNNCDIIQMNTAHILYYLKRYEDALIELKKAYKLNKGDASYLALLAALLILIDNSDEGFDCINKALKIDDKVDSFYYNFACALSIKNKIIDSLEYLKVAITLNEKNKEEMLIEEDFENLRMSINIKEIFGIEPIIVKSN